MDIIRPMQLGFNQRVLEQDRKFYFTASATLGIHLLDGREQVDALYLKDAFQGNPDEPPLLDVGFPKPCGEFLVSGSFHAPGKTPVRGGKVRARVGGIEKQLYVFGPRQWKNGLPTEPETITTLPLIYQNAFGGEGYELNTKGKGYKDNRLPLIESPKSLVGSQKDTPVPACFSALDMMDPRRMQHKGTYDLDYKEKYFPGHPADMDWKMFMLTPKDQWQNGFFNGDEAYLLEHMHPEFPRIEGRFPGLYPRCFIKQETGTGDLFGELPLSLDTIWLFPEKLLGLLIFRGVTEVEDDEAQTITHVLGAYEYRSREPRPLSYYEAALKKRITGSDLMAKLLTTSDLIPEDHPCALELLMDMADSEKPPESQLAKNAKAKSAAMQDLVDEQIQKAAREGANPLGEKAGFSIQELMEKKPEPPADPDVAALYGKMEEKLTGITTGDIKKVDWKNFSFDKLAAISDVASEFAQKKKEEAGEEIEKKLGEVRGDLQKQVDDIDANLEQLQKSAGASGTDAALSGQIRELETSKKDLQEKMDGLMLPEEGKPLVQPLPRVEPDEIFKQLDKASILPPGLIGALQHVQAQKAAGLADESTGELERQIMEQQKQQQEEMETLKQTLEEQLKTTQENFKKGYLDNAHFMDPGLSPHKKPIEAVRNEFLDALSNQDGLADRDWACLDLSGLNLQEADLSGAFLEQVNFKGANLKGANLSGANLARACLDGADLSDTRMVAANIGGVSGIDTRFAGADMTGAKLSKSSFQGAVFEGARMERIEAMDVTMTDTDMSRTRFYVVFFMNARMSGVKFNDADVELSVFFNPRVTDVDFSGSVFNRAAFLDARFETVCFDRCDLSNSVFAASSPEASAMDNISFKEGKFFQTNFMYMKMKHADFTGADLTKAFFWESDLSCANLSHTRAKQAQFRKAKLTGAVLDHMNMPQGSFAKAHLVDASFKGANLYQTDFLRSTITRTDFWKANLDTTLIENWRPK